MTVSGLSAMTFRRPSLDFLDSSDDEAILFDDVDDSEEDLADRYGAPIHPIGAMQGPFTESIADSKDHSESGKNPLQFSNLTPEDRRGRLLQGIDYNDTYSALWRANPHNDYHPLAKIFAQIAFGVHLLHQTAARSNDEVITILQRHIDDVDEFVRRADEDLEMAMVDIGERINHLKIPLEHISTFETMLEDRQYRMSTLEGNENIERIVSRTASLMDDLLADIKCGTTSIKRMSEYFVSIGKTWPSATVSFGLYNRMLANTEGWSDCFDGLKLKGNSLGASLVQLSSFLNEIAKRAGIASRRQVRLTPFSLASGISRVVGILFAVHSFFNQNHVANPFEIIITRTPRSVSHFQFQTPSTRPRFVDARDARNDAKKSFAASSSAQTRKAVRRTVDHAKEEHRHIRAPGVNGNHRQPLRFFFGRNQEAQIWKV
jgi:hypothetical protein